MAIQFRCPACSQAIEVDDDLARQEVMCPFCRATTVAPSETNLQLGNDRANPHGTSADSMSQAGADGDSEAMPGPPPDGNRWSWLALGCTCATIISMIALFFVFYSIGKRLEPSTDRMVMQQRMTSELRQRPAMAYVAIFSACVLPFAAALFAIFALFKRTPPRWPAVLSLCLLLGGILLSCIWGIVSAKMFGAGTPTG